MRTSRGQFAAGSKHLVTHGMARTKVYGVWRSMRSRCENPRTPVFANYGGRGIAVCDRWKKFAAFYEDMGDPQPGMTLERIDNDGPYSPENCRWATRIEQARNTRGSHLVTAFGEERTLSAWAEANGIKMATLWARLKKGWPAEKALLTPVRQDKRWHGAEHGVEWTEPTEHREAA